MEINGTGILDTFAEAFPVWLSRVIITAATREWAYKAAVEATGFATSKIGCSCEAGIERYLSFKRDPGWQGRGLGPDLFRKEEHEIHG